ncbi:MAG: hypothetical protein A2064_00575 [Spirochaetes bacterium GWB1_66_5]|nr:MAG: hypothetical protein A2064_00575 [Spirochaetes bacterium GWB1_66_5]
MPLTVPQQRALVDLAHGWSALNPRVLRTLLDAGLVEYFVSGERSPFGIRVRRVRLTERGRRRVA